MPEGQYHLAHAAIYLATAPKSNSALGYFDALDSVEAEAAEVPSHLKDASRDAKGFGHGEGYLYPHAYRDHWVAQQYLPEGLRGRVFYQPGALGLEGERRAAVLERREAQLAAPLRNPRTAGAGLEGEEFAWSRRARASAEWRSQGGELARPLGSPSSDAALFEIASPRRATASSCSTRAKATSSGRPCGAAPRARWRRRRATPRKRA